MVRFHVGTQSAAQILRGKGLADGADVVLFAFDRQEKGLFYRPGRDEAPFYEQCALGKSIFLENALDGLEIEVGVEVHYREIFLVEGSNPARLFEVPLDPALEHVGESFGVALRVHAHEGGDLQEARVDAPAGAGKRFRHDSNQVLPKPLDRFGCRQFVDLRRRNPRVDRSRHQRQACGLVRVVVFRHQSHGRKRGDGGLANRHDMRLRPHELDEVDEVLDEFVDAENAGVERYVAGIAPVGDIDVVIAQQGLDRAAQERGEMAGHGGDKQHARLVLGVLAREAQQVAKGRRQHGFFHDVHDDAVELRQLRDAEFRTLMGEARETDEFVVGLHATKWRDEARRSPLAQQALAGQGRPPNSIAYLRIIVVGIIHRAIAFVFALWGESKAYAIPGPLMARPLL